MDFESELVNQLKDKNQIVDCGGDPTNPLPQIAQALRGTAPGSSVYAIGIAFPQFIHAGVTYAVSKPDFIKFSVDQDGRRAFWQIIDAKASKKVKLEHKIQVGFYALLFQRIISGRSTLFGDDGAHISGAPIQFEEFKLSPLTTGAVWLPGPPLIVREFPLEGVLNLIHECLQTIVPGAVLTDTPPSRHASTDCGFCPHRTACWTDARERKTIEMIGDLTTNHVKILSREMATETISDIESLLPLKDGTDPIIAAILAIDPATGISPKIVAARECAAVMYSAPLLDLPHHEDIAIYVALAVDSLNDSLIGYAINDSVRLGTINDLLQELEVLCRRAVKSGLSIFVGSVYEAAWFKKQLLLLDDYNATQYRSCISAWLRADPDAVLAVVQDDPLDAPLLPTTTTISATSTDVLCTDIHLFIVEQAMRRVLAFPGPGSPTLEDMESVLDKTRNGPIPSTVTTTTVNAEFRERAIDNFLSGDNSALTITFQDRITTLRRIIALTRDICGDALVLQSRKFFPTPLEDVIQIPELRTMVYACLLEAHLAGRRLQYRRSRAPIAEEVPNTVPASGAGGVFVCNIERRGGTSAGPHGLSIVCGTDVLLREASRFTKESVGFPWIVAESHAALLSFNDDLFVHSMSAPTRYGSDPVASVIVFGAIDPCTSELTISPRCHGIFGRWLRHGCRRLYICARHVDFTLAASVRNAVELNMELSLPPPPQQEDVYRTPKVPDQYTSIDLDDGSEPMALVARSLDPNTSLLVEDDHEPQQPLHPQQSNAEFALRVIREGPALGRIPCPSARTMRDIFERHELRSHFLPSQLAALDRTLQHRLTAVWGPPGTGKTYFLALTCLRLMEAHHRALIGSLRIAVTALTKTAIAEFAQRFNSLREQGIRDGWLT
ncbi:Tripartite DNA replication factor, partial [Gonapodya sp. JEL0774]